MHIIRRCTTVFIATVLAASSSSPQSQMKQMKLCELMRDPAKYNGKLVKVRATWVYGFEWSFLHCLDCEGKVWLDTSDVDEESQKTLKHTPEAGIVNVDVVGVFYAGGSFGHLNGYKYQITVHSVANPVVLLKGMKTPEREREIERKFACGGEKPR